MSYCAYHPDIRALGMCENCGNQYCREDRQIYRQRLSLRNASMTYCLPCVTEKSMKVIPWLAISAIVFIIGLLLLIRGGETFEEGVLYTFIGSMLLLGFVLQFYLARNERRNFFSSLSTNEIGE